MKRLFYDLHIHSCLSPCGDRDMTPNNIVGMAKLNGLDVIALCDHNSAENCPAVAKVCEQTHLLFIPGCEVCTEEEAHVVCLFPDVERALAFSRRLHALLPPVKNKEEAFGRQSIMDANDEETGIEPLLLITGAAVSVNDLPALVDEYGGFCFPAHIDRNSFSILSNLGAIPPECGFTVAELRDPGMLEELQKKHPELCGLHFLTDSDAHYLENIAEAERYFDVPDGLATAADFIGLLKEL